MGTPTVTTCGGFFLDSGGRNNEYSPNEDLITTICSDGSSGTHTQLTFSVPDIAIGDQLCFFDGIDTSATQLTCHNEFDPGAPFIVQATAANTSGCLTVRFRSNGSNQGRGWSASIACIAACQTIQADLLSTSPAAVPADTGWIDICPGDRVEFSGKGLYPQDGIVYNHSDATAEFEWTFGDGTTAVGPSVAKTFSKPGGYTVQLTITDQFGCRNTNFINQRVRVATKPEFLIGGDLPAEICPGDTVSLNAVVGQVDSSKVVSAQTTEGFFQFGQTRSDSLALPDGTGRAYITNVNFRNFLPGQVLEDVNDLLGICVNIEHSWMRDLEIKLSCPNGSTVTLHNHAGHVGGEIYLGEPIDFDILGIRPGRGYDYCWTPDATRGTWLDYANQNSIRTLPPGDYNSYQDLQQLEGCPLNGEWTIMVEDLWASDNGFIFSWGINFDPRLYPNLERYTPEITDFHWREAPDLFFESKDSIAAAPTNSGSAAFTFELTDDFGCNYDTTVQVGVLAPTHPDCYNCQELIAPPSDTAVCDGQAVTMDTRSEQPQSQEITFESFPDYPIGFSNHPPSNPFRTPIEIAYMSPDTLRDPEAQIVSVCLDLETDWDEDISLALQSPTGQVLQLSSGNGGSDDNYTNTCFSPAATVPISQGQAPFSGSYRPEGSWSVFTGASTNGQWQLLVSDALGNEEMGRLKSWSITFRSTNQITYQWSPADGLSCTDCPDPTFSPEQTTTYILNVTDSYGCSVEDSVVVGLVPNEPPPAVTCTATNDNEITFSWSPPANTLELEARVFHQGATPDWSRQGDNNTFVVGNLDRRDEVRLELRYFAGPNPVDCATTQIASATCILQPCAFSLELAGEPTAASCFDTADGAAEVLINEGQGPFTFFLDDDPTAYNDGAFTGLSGGDHFVAVEDGEACVDTIFFNVGHPDSITLTIQQTKEDCPGLMGNEAQVSTAGGNGGFTYTWSDGQRTATALNLDSIIYTVTVEDSQGCQQSDSIKLQDLPEFNPNVIISPPSCFGYVDGQMGINLVEGGLSQDLNDYSFRWSTGSTDRVISGLATGPEYSVTVTGPEGCQVIVRRDLPEPSLITFDVEGENTLCHGEGLGSAAVTNVQGDYPVLSYQWDAGTGNQTTATAVNLPAGTYMVTVTDVEGCFVSGMVTLTEPPPLVVETQQGDNDCFGQQNGFAEVDIGGGTPSYRVRWSTGDTLRRIENLASGDYVLSVSDANNCQYTDTINISQPPVLTATTTPTDPSCYEFRDGGINIQAQGGMPPYLYSLDNENFNGSSTFVGLGSGAYDIFIRDSKGCLYFDKAELQDPLPLTVNAGPDVTILLGDSLQLMASSVDGQGEVIYVWTAPYEGTLSCSECPDPVTTTQNTITYELYGIDSVGCEATDFIQVNVDKPRVVEVPTGFTPNDDGQNDRLLVHGRNGTIVRRFLVFDRWGELVYEARDFEVNDPNTGWDGTFKGQPMNGGVFIWFVEVEFIDGAEEAYKGQTTLIR